MSESICVRITEFTDPGCPWAWSAEPFRARLDYLYGDRIEWRVRMVGIHEDAKHPADGFDPEADASRLRRLARDYGMPIDTRPRAYSAGTLPACRAVVAVKEHQPQCTRRILRELRVRTWRGEQLDDPSTVHGAAATAGIDAAQLDEWIAGDDVEESLHRDMALAREPLPAARVLDHKLSNWSGGRRYSCPSYEIERLSDGVRMAIPGFQPFAAYGVVLANLVPGMDRREPPGSALEVLEWGAIPMATREVATVMECDDHEAREQLARSDARFEPVGADGFWSLSD